MNTGHSPQVSDALPEPLATLNPAFIDGMQAALIVIDQEYRVLLTNKFAQNWVKRTSEEMLRQPCYRLFHGLDSVCSDCPSVITFRTGETAYAVHTGLDKEGGTTYAELTTHPIKAEDGAVLQVIEYVKDVSEKIRVEQDILVNNRRLAALNDLAATLSSSTDVEEELSLSLTKLIELTQGDGGTVFLLNDSGGELVLSSHLGMSPPFIEVLKTARGLLSKQRLCTAAISGEPVSVHNLADDPRAQAQGMTSEGIQALASVPLRSRNRVIGVLNIIRRENREFAQGDIDLLIAAGNQIGIALENAFLLRSLKESEQKYRTVVENSNDVIWTLDRDGNFVWFNHRGEEILDCRLEDLVGRPFAPLVRKESYATVQQVFAETLAGHSQNYEVGVNRNNSLFILSVNTTPIFSSGEVVGTVSFGKDITEKKRMESALWESEEQLRRAQRLEMAGKVAGQVAHDFNNLLGPLVGYPELIKMELSGGHPVAKYCDSMLSAALQMADINEDLLTLSRRGHFNQVPLVLNSVIEQAIANLPPRPGSLTIILDLAKDLLPTRGSAAQLLRVITNLLANAQEAMHDAGQLRIETRNIYIDEPFGQSTSLGVGEYVKLCISDTGPGIPPEIKDKIFEPFFTTKIADAKRGSGLGLSIVQVILDDHHGSVHVVTEEGKGTAFEVYLPVCRETPIVATNSEIPLGTGAVLIVDDDETQREVVRQLLERLGYSVAAVETGEKAITYLEQQAVDLLLLDMIMPGGIDGTQTYRYALKVSPGLRAIIMSGYAETERVREALQLGAGVFLRKPVTLEKLAKAVQGELSRKV